MSALCTAADSIHVPLAYRSILPLLVVTVGALALLALSAVLPKRSLPGLYPGLSALIGLGAVGTGGWEWYDDGRSSLLRPLQRLLLDFDRRCSSGLLDVL
jgi:hypothetical protein